MQKNTEAENAQVKQQDPQMAMLLQVANRQFGIPLDAVTEVFPAFTPIHLPGYTGAIRAVINIRSEILPLLDMRNILTGETSTLASHQCFVLCACAKKRLALLVDSVGEIISLDETSTRPLLLGSASSAIFSSFVLLENETVPMLNPDAISDLVSDTSPQIHPDCVHQRVFQEITT